MSSPGIFAVFLRLELDVSHSSARTAATGLALLLGLGAAGSAAAQATPGKRQPVPAELVKVALVADTTHVRPGKKLTVAVRFDIAPGWHIYWENPGEAGLATEAAISAPAGYEVGAVRFPGPDRFQTPGETAASYGYSEAAVVSSSVAAPARAGEPARFSVQASWLACRDVCVRGKGTASLELPVAGVKANAKPANEDLFRRHREALPRAFSELGAAQRWERDARGARLVVGVKRADRVEYFPPTGEDLQLVGQAAAPGKDGASELRLSYKPGFKPARARGVLAVTKGAERRYYALNLEEKP